MKKILDTRFAINGLLFIIHHNDKRTKYEGKYKLMMYSKQIGSWMLKATDDSMKYLKKYAEDNALYWYKGDMTEKIKSAVSIIENEKECVQSDCDRDCSRCELVKEESEIIGAFNTAIRSLNAWGEVLQELHNIQNNPRANLNQYFINGIDVATEIINHHLAEIEK